jgi:hypothetical protein
VKEEQTIQPQQPSSTAEPAPANGTASAPSIDTMDALEEEGTEVVVHMPDPSIWPLVIATGTALLMLGLVMGLWLLGVGVAVLVIGIGGWLYQDIQVARRSEHH